MADPFTGGQNSRASSALQKRQESLRKWKISETAREPTERSSKRTKIKFSLGTVFLSAVSAGDVDEVKKLLGRNNDINYQNVDGLTALHQACIDENYELVSLLVDNGADLGIRDNEGWTPLHAAASCGSVEIAQLLIDNGADVALVNNEGELPLDLAEEDDMEDLLTDEIERLGIDPEDARGVEERVMLEDAQGWLNKKSINETKDQQGATALHVAAAKGYLKVINLLFQIGVDINAEDSDGWTALHAAAHWGQKEACETLSDHGAGFNIRNKTGSTPIDLAEPEMVKFLEDLKRSQTLKPRINATTSPVIKTNKDSTGAPPLKRRSSITRIKDPQLFLKDISKERAIEAQSPKTKMSRAPSFSESESPKEDKEEERIYDNSKNDEDSGDESDTEESSEETSEEESEEEEEKKKPVVNSLSGRGAPLTNSIHSSSRRNVKPESRNQKESESETESSSSGEEEEEEEPARRPTRPFARPTARMTDSEKTRVSSTPVGQSSKTDTTSSLLSRTVGGRTFASSREEGTSRPRLSNFPARTTASSTSVSSSTTSTSSSFGSRATSTPSEDSQSRVPRSKRVTKRSGTAFVAGGNPKDEDEDEEEKNNDRAKKVEEGKSAADSGRSYRREDRPVSHPSGRTTASTDTYSSRRGRLVGVTSTEDKDKNDTENSTYRGRNSRLADQNKENEEVEIPAWKRRALEREKEREKDKEKEKKNEEKEKEKDNDSTTGVSSRQKRRKSREQRRGTGVAYLPVESDDEASEEVKEAKKNTKLNEDSEEKERTTGRRTRVENKQDEVKVGSERPRRGDALGASKANAVEIKERDPEKLRSRLQETQLEVQDYKIKLEKALQAKEELARKLQHYEDEIKQLDDLKADNQRLKDENGALIRVISRLTPRPT